MQPLTEEEWQEARDLAGRYGVSGDALLALLRALEAGHGTLAQFSHPELGGAGQWMRGGMTMVGDLFDHALKAKVDGLCRELSALLSRQPSPPPAGVPAPAPGGDGGWWPPGPDEPTACGGQGRVRYAYFADARRLAVEVDGRVTVYDTLGHPIGGVAQQQGGGDSLTFTGEHGPVRVADLPVLSVAGGGPNPAGPAPG